MYISFANLVEMCDEVKSVAGSSSNELREQTIEEVLVKYKVTKKEYARVYNAEELRRFPVGSMFQHSKFGKGEVQSKKGTKGNFITFECGQALKFNDPLSWSDPMLFLGKNEKE